MLYTIRRHALPTYYNRCPAELDIPFNVSLYEHPTDSPITALHYHRAEELGICLCGEGELHIEDRVYRYGAGDIQFVSRHTPHYSSADRIGETKWIWITFRTEEVLAKGGFSRDAAEELALRLSFASAVFSSKEAERLSVSAEMLREEWEAPHGALTPTLALTLGQTLSALLRLAERESAVLPVRPTEERADAVRIAPALERIAATPGEVEGLGEEALAALCGMSTSHLRRLFHKVTGNSPKAFIMRSRMAYAENLLRKTKLSVLDVALVTGYENVSCFHRTFVRFFGISPGKYRREHGG